MGYINCSSAVQDWSAEIILSGEDTLLEGESIWNELVGVLHVERHNRSLQHDHQADRLPVHVLLLQQPKVVDMGELRSSCGAGVLRDRDRLHICDILPARIGTAGKVVRTVELVRSIDDG